MKTLYNLGIQLFTLLAYLVAPFNHKARLWVSGRKNWFGALKSKINSDGKYVWFHCASLGEFEQGRPLIEAIKKIRPHIKIVLTFFSPSGYEVRKNYQNADIICYLPSDTPGNAERFVGMINPEFVIFVKYEFWHNFTSAISKKGIPLYLVSGIFRRDQHFFKGYGTFFRKILMRFTWIFVQDQNSLDLLRGAGIISCSVAGDTRFDRVAEIAASARDISQIEKFRGEERLFLAGSSWLPDEEIIAEYINRYPERMKWIFAPHEIEKSNIERLEKLFKVKCVRFSDFDKGHEDSRVMIIDNMGMLSSAYSYAYIAAVGGGFGKGIHNILEPASWNIPVIFGPAHRKFREAVEMLKEGGAGTFKDYNEFEILLTGLINDERLYRKSADSAGRYIKENCGATAKIMSRIN